KWPADFRISETPIFLTHEFTNEAVCAANEIAAQTQTPEFNMHSSSAIPPGWEVPNESEHPEFLIVDLAVCDDGHRLMPRLIELQAFPSLFAFQFLLLGCMRKTYPAIPPNWTSSFGGIKDEQYIDILRRTILADSKPENVILLEIELEVAWVPHPNWYYRISKHALPVLKTAHTSPAFFADQFSADEEIGSYVLKPLYSFAGLGVDMEPTREKLAALKNPHHWILQKK